MFEKVVLEMSSFIVFFDFTLTKTNPFSSWKFWDTDTSSIIQKLKFVKNLVADVKKARGNAVEEDIVM